MDVNEKINWMPGMELTAETFRELENSFDFRQNLALKAALGRNQLGLLPHSEFECRGVFVKNTFEINNLKCLAILPSGKLINADQEVTVNIPMLYGEEYYLGISLSDERHHFERDSVPFYRYKYDFSIYTLEDLKKKDVFPIVKFLAKDSILSLYPDYIVPVIFISENKRFSELAKGYSEELQKLISHPNLEEGEGKRCLLRYLFVLNNIDQESNVKDFISLIQEIVQAIDYFIIRPNWESAKEIPMPDYYDIEKWLGWVGSYLEGAEKVLDKVILEDHSIDYDALLEQAKQQLYDKLRPELLEKLPAQIKEEVYKDMAGKLKEFLPEYLKEKIDEIKIRVGEELSQLLEPKLFDDLYQKLYDALYVAPEEEEEFMPMI